MIYGYARCSTNESKQDVQRQVRELKDAGAVKIFLEYEHRDSLIKKELDLLFSVVVAGDTIIVTEVTRLAGSTKQLCEVLDLIKEKKLKLIIKNSLTLDCIGGQADPMSEAFLQMAGVFSQLELSMIRSRVRSGMANAKAKGVKWFSSPLPIFQGRKTPSFRIGESLRSEPNYSVQIHFSFGTIENREQICVCSLSYFNLMLP